jgi:hypothetical protein
VRGHVFGEARAVQIVAGVGILAHGREGDHLAGGRGKIRGNPGRGLPVFPAGYIIRCRARQARAAWRKISRTSSI